MAKRMRRSNGGSSSRRTSAEPPPKIRVQFPSPLQQIKMTEASAMLEGRHYLGGLETSPRFVLTNEQRDALAVYTTPIASSFTKDNWLESFQPLELARLWQSDESTRPVSQFLAMTLRALKAYEHKDKKKHERFSCVFSYADPMQKNLFNEPHLGTIYRACNFTCLGLSRATDHWLTADGEKVSAPKMFRITARHANNGKASNKGGTKSDAKVQALFPGRYTYRPGAPKLLYVYGLRMTVLDVCELIGGRYRQPLTNDDVRALLNQYKSPDLTPVKNRR